MPDFLNMSDDDFAKQSPPVVEASSETTPSSEGVEQPIEPAASETTPEANANDQQVETPAEPKADTPVEEEQKPDEEIGDAPPVVVKAEEELAKTPEEELPNSPSGSAEQKPAAVTVEEKPIDYEAAYKELLTPFKANGKMIQVNDLAEAKQLMQMGANFTKKMQEIQPHRKMLMMLDNNGLLDEGRLSFLIDLDKKDPEAIKKLIKESGINPMDIDVESEPAYQAGNHRVTDEAVNFNSVLSDLSSNPEGKETLQLINREWDQASKEALWKEPGVMTIIHDQRTTGMYAVIQTEVDRLRTLGTIPPDIPFIQAYKVVGENLAKAGKLNQFGAGNGEGTETVAKAVSTPASSVPLAQRVVAPKPIVSNSAQAQAALQQRSAPRKVEQFVNPLAMSDDEFLAQMKNRV